MSVRSRNLSIGKRWAFDKMIRGTRIFSPYVYRAKSEAQNAEYQETLAFLHGKPTTLVSGSTCAVGQLINARVLWLREHRSKEHAISTERAIKRALCYAKEWIDLPVTSITSEMVAKMKSGWAADLAARGKTNADINKTLGYLQSCWSHPWDNKRERRTYPDNPFLFAARLPESKKAKSYPTPKQIRGILSALKEKIALTATEKKFPNSEKLEERYEKSLQETHLYLQILVNTGARPGEAVSLKGEDIGEDSVTLWTAKKRGGTRTPRKIQVGRSLTKQIRDWQKKNPDSIYLFQMDERPEPRVYRWIINLQIAACAGAKVPYFTVHGYRHYFTSNLVKKGVDLAKIQRILGHENFATTAKYIHELMGV